jgi:isopentenyldiphosphate isomerase
MAKPKKLSPEQAQERALMELIAKELGVHTDSEDKYRHSNESLLSQIHYRAKKCCLHWRTGWWRWRR